MAGPPRGILLVLALFLLATAAVALFRLTTPPTPRERLEEMRSELRALRTASDSCLGDVAAEEERLLSYHEELDSLHGRVRELESLDPRGVPADSYTVYLEVFERYNAGVPTWKTWAETLQAHWGTCREISASHNTLADSARRLAEELGLWPEKGSGGVPP